MGLRPAVRSLEQVACRLLWCGWAGRPPGVEETDAMTAMLERMNAIERTACLIAGAAVGAVFITLIVG